MLRAEGETRAALDLIEAQHDPRIKVHRLRENVGIARASNAALSLASGAYVGLLDHDDELTHDALFEVAKRVVADAPDMLYSDEDKINEENLHVEAHFKPDFSPDYLSSNNYICHFSVIRREILDGIGGFRPGFDGAQDYDLILRVSEATEKIVHVPMVLYHWRKIAGSTSADSSAKPKTTDAGARALTDWAKRRGISGGHRGRTLPKYVPRQTRAARRATRQHHYSIQGQQRTAKDVCFIHLDQIDLCKFRSSMRRQRQR